MVAVNEHPLWVTILSLALLCLAIVGSCQAYNDCIADGRPSYECRHYSRMVR